MGFNLSKCQSRPERYRRQTRGRDWLAFIMWKVVSFLQRNCVIWCHIKVWMWIFLILSINVAETTKSCLNLLPLSSAVFEPFILRRPISNFKEGCFPGLHCSNICVSQQGYTLKWCVQFMGQVLLEWRRCSVLPFLLVSSMCCRDHGGSDRVHEGQISHQKWLFAGQLWSPSPWKRNKILPLLKKYYLLLFMYVDVLAWV